jgi:transposase-like protein
MWRMDRTVLKLLLDQGNSLAAIGRRFDRHEATVSYWVKKHGLEAAYREKHSPRGELALDDLRPLVDSGASIAAIARELGRAQGTVKHWLRHYGLRTSGQSRYRGEESTRAAKAAGTITVKRVCRHHGLTDFWLEGRGYYRCQRCRCEAVIRRRRKIKQILVDDAGGCCVQCGYDRCMAALHFHHLDRASKAFHLSEKGVTRSLASARAEARKCVLLCSNCHAEVESGVAELIESARQARVA